MARPWEALPAEEVGVFAPHLPRLADEIIAAIAAEVPAYARPLEGAFGRGVRRGVEQALVQFVEMVQSPGAGRGAGRDVYVGLGRGEVRAGRSLDALLAAYRVGARVAWRRLADVGLEAGLPPRTLVRLAESIFAYIDELSAESAEGFAQEQTERAGELDRRRRTLIELLLRIPPPEAAAVDAAAEEARWRLPGRMLVVVWRSSSQARRPVHLPVGTLVASVEDLECGLVPDPQGPGRGAELDRALAHTVAGVGPAVEAADAARSFRRAVAALGLAEDRGLEGAVRAEDHRAALLLRADPELVAEMAERRLAPLAGQSELSRRRLTSTLLAWLRHDGSVPAAAAELDVHAQTVRYRLNRLRELFGAQLDDPDARFELELALRALHGHCAPATGQD